MTYLPRSIKRNRRSKSEIESFKASIYGTLSEEQPMTIRHLFYRLVSKGVLDKTEGEYKATLVRLLSSMRRNGEVPFYWLADNTRWMRKPRTHTSIANLLDDCGRTYRRALWNDQQVYVEVWCEKEAISSILYQVTDDFDVPLMACHGFASISFIQSAAENIKEQDKPAHILYFGDHDPSGQSISHVLERDLKAFSGDADITFRRLAVNEPQITDWNLPTRPTKKTDSRSKNFIGESVEVDAIPAKTLQTLAFNAIRDLIDPAAYDAVRASEASERDSLRIFTQTFLGGAIN